MRDLSFTHLKGGSRYHPHLYWCAYRTGIVLRIGHHEFMVTWGEL